MKQEVIIRLKDINNRLNLTAKVSYEGRPYFITKSGKYFADEIPKTEEIQTLVLDKTHPVHRITWDDTPHDNPEEAKKGRLKRVMDETYRMIATLWQYHMQIEVLTSTDPKINQNKKGIRFYYEHVNKRHTNKVQIIRKRVAIENRVLDINDTDPEAFVDLAYYFLPAVASKKHSEIICALIDHQTGLLFQEPHMTNFLQYYKESDPEVIRMTIVKKAIALKIIEEKRGEGFWLYQQYAGAQPHFVCDYLRANDKIYQALTKEVRNGELIVEDQLDQKEMAKKNDDRLIEGTNEATDIRNKAKALGIKTWHVTGIEKLKLKIKEIEEMQEQQVGTEV